LVQRNLVQVVPVVLFFILIAGMFSVVLVPVNIEVYGTVTDNEGNPLNHVYMEVYGSDGLKAAEGGVDSQGRFSLFIHHYGEYEVWATMRPDYPYWAQFQKVKFESQENNVKQRLDFQLVRDIPCNVTLIAQFWTVNSTHTSISFGYAQQGEIATHVEGIGPDYPYNSTISYITYGSTEGSSSEGGHVLLLPCSITGYYSDTPGSVISCHVKGDGTMGTLGLPAADYLSPENASEGWIEELQPESLRELKIWPRSNYTLPDAFSIPVDVDILGKRFQTILPCTMLGANPSPLSIWVSVTNLDSVPHSYKFFVEGGHIIHIWEVS
jgi:hypothetical protein